jgi:hypothetical protein
VRSHPQKWCRTLRPQASLWVSCQVLRCKGIFFSRSHTGWFVAKTRSHPEAVNTDAMCTRENRRARARAHCIMGAHHTMLTACSQRPYEATYSTTTLEIVCLDPSCTCHTLFTPHFTPH